jgi:hypothetical protein
MNFPGWDQQGNTCGHRAPKGILSAGFTAAATGLQKGISVPNTLLG